MATINLDKGAYNIHRLHYELEYLHDREISIRNELLYDIYSGRAQPIPKSEIICHYINTTVIFHGDLISDHYEKFIKKYDDPSIPIENFTTILSLKCGVVNGHVNGDKYCTKIKGEIECKQWIRENQDLGMSDDESFAKFLRRGENDVVEGIVYTDVNFYEFKTIRESLNNKFPIY